ncbi:hypothetical protein LSAT2_025345 [Lamellibrachia satsuma]|nr:hypothetical protein LSAT2_025345 [Lamellibrachia satsuma]
MGIVKQLVGFKAANELGVFVCSKRVQLRIRGASSIMTSFVRAILLVTLVHCVIWRTAHTTNKSPVLRCMDMCEDALAECFDKIKENDDLCPAFVKAYKELCVEVYHKCIDRCESGPFGLEKRKR